MLVTNMDEIRAYLPTSVYSGDESLLALMEETEESALVPVLGEELYGEVCRFYSEAVEKYGGVIPQVVPAKEVTQRIRLVRRCQMPVVYLTLANSTGIMTVNLNDGGGLNRSYTEMFDKADDSSVNRFERDAWFKGHRGIDRLLLFLEDDAKSEQPEFAELWKKSRYFYLQGDLLFTTAECMNRYLDIGGSREKFIQMLPDIRYCQDVYLASEIGEELLEAMVGWCTGASRGNAPEGFGEAWRKAADRLRMALALFVEARRPEKKRRYSENEATLALARAVKFISQNQEAFSPFLKGSPLYVAPETEAVSAEDEDEGYDFDNPDNPLFVFFPKGVNRR